ncbi:hypothetical protein F6X37_11000 [Paraburkholderia sp. 31.1]|uniref:hypothetical protein n=1 Tax=Paraburkholderia sp. 31.1 TaxID=2615205 RepID=UPI0016565DF4|nr:hypothetical protein [Paraburkholderia sp. 31.1]MBC8722101.1 hypothetical protein [Paraburkholderia sp. 31.1]
MTDVTSPIDDPHSESRAILQHSCVVAVIWEHYTITDTQGKPATLAIVDEQGKVLDSGPEVQQEIWDLAILAYRKYLVGEGYLRIHSTPEGLFQDKDW